MAWKFGGPADAQNYDVSNVKTLELNDNAADPGAGAIANNGGRLKFHDGTAARSVAELEDTLDAFAAPTATINMNSQNLSNVNLIEIEEIINFDTNATAEPSTEGELSRHAGVLKYHDGTAARTLANLANSLDQFAAPAATVDMGSQRLNNVLQMEVEDYLLMENAAADPAAPGEFQRNGTDLKFHDGSAARILAQEGVTTLDQFAAPAATVDWNSQNLTSGGTFAATAFNGTTLQASEHVKLSADHTLTAAGEIGVGSSGSVLNFHDGTAERVVALATGTVVTNLNADLVDGVGHNDGATTSTNFWSAEKTQNVITASVSGVNGIAVRVKATANVDLTADLDGATIGGVALSVGDLFYTEDQTDSLEDGVYEVASGAGNTARYADDGKWDSGDDVAGFIVTVLEGTHDDSRWLITNNPGSGVLGTDALVSVKTTGGEANTASNVGSGTGLFKQKSVADLEFYSVDAGSAKVTVGLNGDVLEVDASEANFDLANIGGNLDVSSQVTGTLATGNGGAGRHAESIGGSGTSYTVTHNLGSKDVHVVVYDTSGNEDEEVVEVRHNATNSVDVILGADPGANGRRVVVKY